MSRKDQASWDLRGKSVLLINPAWNIQVKSIWAKVASCYPSIGLALIAASLEKYGAQVRIIDLQADTSLYESIATVPIPNFVGITTTTVLANRSYEISKHIRFLWPNTKIVFGGVHPTLAPQEVLTQSAADYVIRGEGERSMVLLVAGEEPQNIKGLAMMQDGKYWEHPELDEIEDLDSLPLPSYHLLPMHRYHPPLGGALREPSISIFSTRGCPGRCTYCNSSLSKRMRYRSPQSIVDEISMLQQGYGIKEIGFYDDTFASDPARVRAFCELLKANKIDITWTCMSRINYADPVTLKVMAQAGCHMICYGVESANVEILKAIRKGIKLDQVKPVVKMTQQVGIRTRLSFMYGNPGETVETMKRTLNFAIQMQPDLVQFNITTPYPGTEMYQWADAHDYLTTKDWSQYDFYNFVMKLPTITAEEIYSFYRYSYHRFYTSPSFWLRQIAYWFRHPLFSWRLFVTILKSMQRILVGILLSKR